MAKPKTTFSCNSCGAAAAKWVGRCPACGEWNTVEETAEQSAETPSRHNAWVGGKSELIRLRNVQAQAYPRFSSGLSELDRVLGGGLVPGSVTLVGGDPGVGKSTLLLQTLGHLSATKEVFYATGEESPQQIALRAERLGLTDSDVNLLAEIELEKILAAMDACSPTVAVIDSIQTVYSSMLQAAPGTVSQVKECAAQLTRFAKSRGVAVFLVGHVTKDGSLAGPRVLEHIVDTVLYFEGEQGSPFRMIRALKNRFGAVNELGVLSMSEEGLQAVDNPSSMFLTAHETPVAGSCVLAAMEGNRPFLVEVQALVENAPTPNAKRAATGVDTNRLQMLLAVLHKHAGIAAFDQNVYVKIVGGVKLSEPATDLALLFATHSSLTGRPLPQKLIAFGEVGLAGELRAVGDTETRLKEAAKLGFTQAIIPSQCHIKQNIPGISVLRASRVDAALALLRDL